MSVLRSATFTVVAALFVVSCGGSDGGTITLPPGATRPPELSTGPPGSGAAIGRPGTDAPAVQPPVTEPPVTEPPGTQPPVTEPPAAETPVVTPEPEEVPAATEPTSDADDTTTTWWPWILSGVVLVAIAVAAMVSRRKRKGPRWSTQALALLDESDQITTHLVGQEPSGLGAVAGADANRVAELMVRVQQLIGSAPDDAARRGLAQVQEPLRSLHAALDALTLRQTSPTTLEFEDLRARATALHSATSFARASVGTGP